MPRPVLGGRLSRAAVFAGATLAGCANPPPAQHASPPPDEHQVQHVEQREPDPPPPPGDGGFAKPPVGTAKIIGVLTNPTGVPIPNVRVMLHCTGVSKEGATGADGTFEFRDLQAGDYHVSFQQQSNHPRHQPPRGPTTKVTVADGATEHVKVVTTPYVVPVDRGPCCKPYGAPPARRRVV